MYPGVTSSKEDVTFRKTNVGGVPAIDIHGIRLADLGNAEVTVMAGSQGHLKVAIGNLIIAVALPTPEPYVIAGHEVAAVLREHAQAVYRFAGEANLSGLAETMKLIEQHHQTMPPTAHA